MSLLSRKAKELQNSEQVENISKVTSDKAVDIIKKLSGADTSVKGTVADNYIVFTNMSGGTGASTVACNVAYEAASQGLKVIIIDLNIMCPMQHTYLGIKQSVTEKADLVSYLLGKTILGDSIDSSHIYSLMYANNRTIADLINCNSDASIQTFNEMITKLRKLYDLVLIDCPMNIDNMLCNNVLYNCDTIYAVWDEGLASISNTDRMRRNMSYCGIDSYTKMKVVLNKRTSIYYNMYPFKKLNLELVEVLPFDMAVIESSVKAQIFCEKASSKSKNAAAFEQGILNLTDKILKIGGLVR
jgi:MinD-like ATPase involved in chromosome partitioning or flagellar assembly